MKLILWLAGFFETEAKQSMTRLLAFCCVLIAAGVVWLVQWYVTHTHPVDAMVIGALLGCLGTLIVGGAVALAVRTKPDGTSL